MPSITRNPKPNRPLERDVQAAVREWLATQPDVTIFRNAQAYVQFPDGHKARTGLGTGSADLIGSLTYKRILTDRHRYDETKDTYMTVARALGIEIKRPGERLDPDQITWHDEMRRRGWVVGVAHSVDEARDTIERARRFEI